MGAKTVPDTLKGVSMKPGDTARLEPYLRNWIVLHRYLMGLAMTDYEEVARLLLMELADRCRLPIVDRLTSRYNRMRAIAMHNEISECLRQK